MSAVAEHTPQTGSQPAVPQQSGTVSRLTEQFDDDDATPRNISVEQIDSEVATESTKKDGKKKRHLFGFGRKKDDSTTSTATASTAKSPSKTGSSTTASPSLSRDISKLSSRSAATSPTQSDHPLTLPPVSPSRALSSSPRLVSPAGSQIFERDVQEATLNMTSSPAIPAHIVTENHIPPVLDASSEAITDTHIDPDDVEIITHSAHQPASLAVTGAASPTPHLSYEQLAASWAEEMGSYGALHRDSASGIAGSGGDAASNYGSLDTTDVRRLSFISFADVVQAEHAGHGGPAGSRESMHLAGLTSLSMNRSPSPIRSPVSSQGPGTSPPTSKSGSVKGLEMSPSRKPLGSPTSAHYNFGAGAGGELNVETMSQALRRTGSGDLGGVRSLPTSPVDGPSR